MQGKIGGVNGIPARKEPNDSMHIYEEGIYIDRIDQVLQMKPDILLTHQPEVDGHIYKPAPPLHFCGHWHQKDDAYMSNVDGTYRINCDSRILYIQN